MFWINNILEYFVMICFRAYLDPTYEYIDNSVLSWTRDQGMPSIIFVGYMITGELVSFLKAVIKTNFWGNAWWEGGLVKRLINWREVSKHLTFSHSTLYEHLTLCPLSSRSFCFNLWILSLGFYTAPSPGRGPNLSWSWSYLCSHHNP